MTSHDRRIRSMQKNSTKRVDEKLVQCLRAAPLPRRFHYSSSSLGERTTVLPFFFPSDWKEKILEGIRERWSASLRGVSTVLSSVASPCSLHGLLTESGSRHCFTAESPEHNSAPLYSRSRSFSFFFLFVARIFSLFFLPLWSISKLRMRFLVQLWARKCSTLVKEEWCRVSRALWLLVDPRNISLKLKLPKLTIPYIRIANTHSSYS